MTRKEVRLTQSATSGSRNRASKLLDGAAIVHLLPKTGVSTFDEYASSVFIPYIKKHLEISTRVDVVMSHRTLRNQPGRKVGEASGEN